MVVKIMVPFLDPYHNTAPNFLYGTKKRVHNFDNHPYRGFGVSWAYVANQTRLCIYIYVICICKYGDT